MRSATRSHVVCPDKKAGDILKTSLHDFEGHQTYTEKLGHDYILNKTFAEVKPAEYDAVYVAGGRGPEYIRIDKRVQALVRHFHEAGKPIFTICHGVQILIAVDGVVRGREVAALQYCEPEVTLAGGIYIDVAPTGAHVDGNLVSAKGWPGLAAFMRECLKVLGTEIRHGKSADARRAPGRLTGFKQPPRLMVRRCRIMRRLLSAPRFAERHQLAAVLRPTTPV